MTRYDTQYNVTRIYGLNGAQRLSNRMSADSTSGKTGSIPRKKDVSLWGGSELAIESEGDLVLNSLSSRRYALVGYEGAATGRLTGNLCRPHRMFNSDQTARREPCLTAIDPPDLPPQLRYCLSPEQV